MAEGGDEAVRLDDAVAEVLAGSRRRSPGRGAKGGAGRAARRRLRAILRQTPVLPGVGREQQARIADADGGRRVVLVTELDEAVQKYRGPHTARDVVEGVVLGSAKQPGQGVRHGPQETQRELSHG